MKVHGKLDEKLLFLFVLGLWALLCPVTAQTSTGGVLCSEIQGESTAPGSAGCVDVLSWSWGASVGFQFGDPPNLGQPALQAFVFNKPVDSGSEDFFRLLVTGTPLKETVSYQEFRPCGENCSITEPFLRISMRDVWVTSFSTSGGVNGIPAESITLEFAEISYCYRPVSKGDLGPEQCFAFDRRTNEPITPF